METNDKLMTLLRLMDEPETMTEAQLEELLSDDEVRKAYDVMADCKKVYQRRGGERKSEKASFFTLHSSLRKIAAVFLGVVLLCGLAWATIPHIISSHTDSPQSAQVTTPLPHREGQEGGSFIRFDNVRLDSILTTVSDHYGKAVSFCNDEAKAMKFIMTWNPDAPLSDFIDGLNLFDGLRLSLQRDTIFVETTEGKEDAE